MEWLDHGFVLSRRRHGETSALAILLTREHGRYAGLVRGGLSGGKAVRGILEPGNLVQARWRSRLAENLGTFRVELLRAHAARILDDPAALDLLAAAGALTAALPERTAAPGTFRRFAGLIETLAAPALRLAAFARFEFTLLAELGYGLDAAGDPRPAFIAADGKPAPPNPPGRIPGGAFRLPVFLHDEESPASRADILDALRLTGHFLDRHVYAPLGRTLPVPRLALRRSLERH